ncbi:hypothetical protein [Synechococcus sp. MIT S9451]|uniref:hypothetical protein n=1 Tax=Synechococcus sp. MIT S9451 TaxID=3082543 RepID=UPI0039B65666
MTSLGLSVIEEEPLVGKPNPGADRATAADKPPAPSKTNQEERLERLGFNSDMTTVQA